MQKISQIDQSVRWMWFIEFEKRRKLAACVNVKNINHFKCEFEFEYVYWPLLVTESCARKICFFTKFMFLYQQIFSKIFHRKQKNVYALHTPAAVDYIKFNLSDISSSLAIILYRELLLKKLTAPKNKILVLKQLNKQTT
jgi:hypothetical protein